MQEIIKNEIRNRKMVMDECRVHQLEQILFELMQLEKTLHISFLILDILLTNGNLKIHFLISFQSMHKVQKEYNLVASDSQFVELNRPIFETVNRKGLLFFLYLKMKMLNKKVSINQTRYLTKPSLGWIFLTLLNQGLQQMYFLRLLQRRA